MLSFIIKRLIQAPLTLLLIITVSFFIMRFAPGSPFTGERALTPATLAILEKAYNFDLPLFQQYLLYLKGLLQGDFGPSFKMPAQTVGNIIAGGLPASVKIGIPAVLIAFIVGVSIGSFAALKQNSIFDYTTMTGAMVGIIFPTFVIGTVLQLFLSVQLDIFPSSGWGNTNCSTTTRFCNHIIMPIIAMAIPQIAMFARLTRSSMIENLNSNFVRTAKSKGLSSPRIIIVHTLKGALLPVVTYLAPATAGVLTGSLVIEKIFRIPGIAAAFVDGALNRDYSVVLGTVIIFAIFIILLNLLVDILYTFLDPRIR